LGDSSYMRTVAVARITAHLPNQPSSQIASIPPRAAANYEL
jgi:hypothetical protein